MFKIMLKPFKILLKRHLNPTGGKNMGKLKEKTETYKNKYSK